MGQRWPEQQAITSCKARCGTRVRDPPVRRGEGPGAEGRRLTRPLARSLPGQGGAPGAKEGGWQPSAAVEGGGRKPRNARPPRITHLNDAANEGGGEVGPPVATLQP